VIMSEVFGAPCSVRRAGDRWSMSFA
jgi:hypothetical protein